MARKPSKQLTEVELDIMRVIWRHGEVKATDIRNDLLEMNIRMAAQSVRTMLGILRQKGFVARHKSGRAFMYVALITEAQAQADALTHVRERLFRGSAPRMVQRLVDNSDLSRKDLKHIVNAMPKRKKNKDTVDTPIVETAQV